MSLQDRTPTETSSNRTADVCAGTWGMGWLRLAVYRPCQQVALEASTNLFLAASGAWPASATSAGDCTAEATEYASMLIAVSKGANTTS